MEQNPYMAGASSGVSANAENPYMTESSSPPSSIRKYAGPAAIVASGTIIPYLIRMMMRGKGPTPTPRATLEPSTPLVDAPMAPQAPPAPLQLNPPPISVTPRGTAIMPGTSPEAIQRAQKIEALGRAMQDPKYKIKYFGAAPLAMGPSMGESENRPSPTNMMDVLRKSLPLIDPLERLKRAGKYAMTNAEEGSKILEEAGIPPELQGFVGGTGLKSVTSLAQAKAPGLIKQGVEALKRGISPRFSETPEVRVAAREAMGGQAAGIYRGQRMASPMADFTPQEKILAGEALRGAPEPMVIPKIAEAVAPMRQEIDRLSTEISQHIDPIQHKALLDEIQGNMGTYVRRVYGRDVLGKDYNPPPQALESARKWLRENLVDASDSSVEATIQEIISGKARSLNTVSSGIGKLRNLPPREPGAGAPKATRIDISPLQPREKIPQPIRELMGEVIPGDYVGARTIGDLSSTLANLKFFGAIADNSAVASDLKQVGWTQMPQGARLGKLSGKYVPDALYDDLQELADPRVQDDIDKLYFGMYNLWRFAKTAGDPVTHARNILGNVMFSGFAKVSPTDPRNWTYYSQALSHLSKDSPLLQQAYQDGIIGTEMMGADIKPLIRNLLAQRGDSYFDRITNLASQGVKSAGDLYRVEDQIPKLASYIKQLSQGMSRQDAARYVDRWFPNYKELPRFLHSLRSSKVGTMVASPFTSFTAEATRIFKNASQDPERWGTIARWMLTIPVGLTAASAAFNGVNPSELLEMYKSLPQSEQAKVVFNVLLPWKDRKGQLQVADMSPIVPLGSMFQTKSLLGAVGAENVPLAGNLVGGNPFMMALVQSAMDHSLWTDQEITRPSDMSKMGSKLKFVGQQVAPIPTSIMRAAREYKKGKAPLREQALEAISPIRVSSVPDLLRRTGGQMGKEKAEIIKDIGRVKREGSFEINPYLDRRATPSERASAKTRMERLKGAAKDWEKRNRTLERAYHRSGGH